MENYRKVVSIIKKRFPEYRVSVRRSKIARDRHGDCSYREDGFLIRIHSGLNEAHAIDTFLHEFAHVLAWNAPGDDHGPEWGKAYSKVYRIYLKDYLEL